MSLSEEEREKETGKHREPLGDVSGTLAVSPTPSPIPECEAGTGVEMVVFSRALAAVQSWSPDSRPQAQHWPGCAPCLPLTCVTHCPQALGHQPR